MPAKNSSKPLQDKKDKKDSGDAPGNRAPDRKKPNTKRRGGGAAGNDDDDSVDSRGNIRGLIAYSSEEESNSDVDMIEDISNIKKGGKPPPRKAAIKAQKKIQRKLSNESEKTVEKSRKSSQGAAAAAAAAKKGVIISDSEEGEEEDTDLDDDMDGDATPRPPRKGFLPRKKITSKMSESEDDDEDDEYDEEDDEDYDDDDDEDEEEEADDQKAGLIISFGAADDYDDRMVPKRHNMKKESAEVKKFVKLVTEPAEEGGIDDQIDEFKALSPEKQRDLLEVLDRKSAAAKDPTKQSMMFRLLTMKLPPDIQATVLSKYNAIQNMDPGVGEYYKQRAWLEKLVSLPLGVYREIPVKIADGQEACTAFMERARRCLHESIYGQEEAKLQILQFIASKIANPSARGLSLLLAGQPGIGKTTLIKNGIAKALDWPFQFISLGGDSDASTYVGHQVVYEGSHCGKIANSLIAAKSMSMILMFDELDKISATPKGEEVQNLLVHLTDPVQNADFEDKYLSGIPLDLSKVLFTFSANDLGKIDRILMDRMIVIQLQPYTDKEKVTIAENFLLPNALREVHLDEKVAISREILEYILKEYAKDEKGVREYKRCIEGVIQKVNMLRIFNSKDLPFHIPDFQLPFVIKKSHVDLFLKKKEESIDPSIAHLYV